MPIEMLPIPQELNGTSRYLSEILVPFELSVSLLTKWPVFRAWESTCLQCIFPKPDRLLQKVCSLRNSAAGHLVQSANGGSVGIGRVPSDHFEFRAETVRPKKKLVVHDFTPHTKTTPLAERTRHEAATQPAGRAQLGPISTPLTASFSTASSPETTSSVRSTSHNASSIDLGPAAQRRCARRPALCRCPGCLHPRHLEPDPGQHREEMGDHARAGAG